MDSSKFTTLAAMSKQKQISVEQFADTGAITSRRGKPVSASYIYRLIRMHNKGELITLPFDYVMTGAKDRIYIILS